MGVLTNEKPERTWIDWPHPNATGLAFSCQARPPVLRTEYVRADLVDAEVARLTAEKQEAAARIKALEAEVAALKPSPPSVEHITGVALKEPKRGTTWVCEKPKRHHDVFAMMEQEGANPFCDSPHDCQQGFHTSTGRFVTRLEAMQIAKAAGQLIRPERGGYQGPELFSEDLW